MSNILYLIVTKESRSVNTALYWRCLITNRHFYWERTSWSKQDNRNYFFYMRWGKLLSWLMFQLCPRTACPKETPTEPLMFGGQAEKWSHWYRPSARDSTYDWQNCRSFLSILAQRRISPKLDESGKYHDELPYELFFLALFINSCTS